MAGTGITLNAGSGGASLLVDNDTSTNIDAQVVKIGYSVSNSTPVQVSIANPLPVQVPGSVAVTGTFWQTTQPVSAAALPLPAGAATATNQLATTYTDNSSAYARTTALMGAIGGAVESSAPTLVAGKVAALSLDTAGNLRVNIVAGGGAGGTSLTDAATFTRGATAETPVGGVAETSNPTLTNGKVAALSLDTSGNLRVNIAAGGATAGTAGTPSAAVMSVQGVASMTPVTTTPGLATAGGASYYNAIAPASPAAHAVKASAGNVYGIVCINMNPNAVFLKFWDTSSAPTLGSTAATYQFPVPGNTSGAGFVITLPVPRSHANAIYVAVTGAISTTDNTAIAANTVVLDVAYN